MASHTPHVLLACLVLFLGVSKSFQNPCDGSFPCGRNDITEDECLEHVGCCFNNGSDPQCTYRDMDACSIADNQRIECGVPGIKDEECIAEGCCFAESTSGDRVYPECFHKNTSPFYIYMPNSTSVNEILWLLTHRTWFPLSLKTESPTKLYLSSKPSIVIGSDSYYEVHIDRNGCPTDTEVTITKFDNGNVEDSETAKDQENPDCSAPFTYVLNWEGNKISVGYSSSSSFLTFTDDGEVLPVQSIGIHYSELSNNYQPEYRVSRSNARTAIVGIESESSPDFWTFWMQFQPFEQYVIYRVKAEASARLILDESRDATFQRAIEFKLGENANTETSLLSLEEDDDHHQHTIQTIDILDNNNYRYFWLSWDVGYIESGEGAAIGRNRLLDRYFWDEQPLRFASPGYAGGGTSYWEFGQLQDSVYIVKSISSESAQQGVTVHMNTEKTYFMFSTQTCDDVSVFLATDEAEYTYELRITKEDDNTNELGIYKEGVSEAMGIRLGNHLLHCGEERQFWLDWQPGFFKFGTGQFIDEHELLRTIKDDTSVLSDISGIGLKSQADAEWTFKHRQVISVDLFTSNDVYDRLWVSASHQTYVKFRVNGCDEAYIALAEYAGVTTWSSYEVALCNAEHSQIRDTVGGHILARYSGLVLSCDRWEWFWISWEDGQLDVGNGATLGSGIIMTHKFENFHPINYVGVASSSAETKPVHFEFSRYQGNVYEFTTKSTDTYQHNQFITVNEMMRFEVQACSNATINLATDPNNPVSQSYEIIIGEMPNSRVTIAKWTTANINRLISQSYPGIIDCSELRPFWISWYDGYIAVGQGDVVDSNVLVQTNKDKEPELIPIHVVSLQTKNDTKGLWVIDHNFATGAMFMTDGKYANNRWKMGVHGRHQLIFKVKTISNAILILSSGSASSANSQVYKLTIGASNNQKTRLTRGKNDEVLAEVDSPDILDPTDRRYFWLSWLNGVIEFGQDAELGLNRLLHFHDPNPHAVDIVAFTTDGALGHWEVNRHTSDHYYVKTVGYSDYQQFQIRKTQNESDSLHFEVQVCQDAMVSLLNDQHTILYEIALGALGNTKSYIRKKQDNNMGSDQEVDTPDLLSCHEMRAFRLDWGPGGIHLSHANGGSIIHWLDEEYILPNAVSFTSSPSGKSGQWRIRRRSGESAMVHTNAGGKLKFERFWASVSSRRSITVSVQACITAHVVLAKYLGLTGHYAYEINIDPDTTIVEIYRYGVLCGRNKLPSNFNMCHKFEDFWLSWENQRIQFGMGQSAGSSHLASCDMVNDHVIDAASFDTEGDGFWSMVDDTGDVYKFMTTGQYPGEAKFERVWLVPSRRHIVFDVEALDWLVILLRAQMWNDDPESYEIHLGKRNGTQQVSYIYNRNMRLVDVEVNTPGLISSGGLVSLWISWEHSRLSVGMGHRVHRGVTLMNATQDLAHTINEISFGSAGMGYQKWHVPKSAVRHVRTWTHVTKQDNERFDITCRDTEEILFSLLGSGTAEVAFSERVGSIEGHHLLIGGDENTRTTFSNSTTELISKETRDIINVNELRTFWASWKNGEFHFGKGGVIGQNEIFFLMERMQPNSVTFYNSISHSGIWEVGQIEGNSYDIFTAEEAEYDRVWIHTENKFLSFKVRACQDAHVLISTDFNKTDKANAVEVVIGSSGNQAIVIRRGSLQEEGQVSGQIPHLLHCDDFRTFWVRWDEDLVQVGSGSLDNHLLLEMANGSFPTMSYISLGSWYETFGEWRILQDAGDFNFYTKQDFQSKHSFLMTEGIKYVVFQVEVCNGGQAQILLSRWPHVLEYQTYEVVIETGGTVSIKRGVGESDSRVISTGETLLVCGSMQTFWIWWVDDHSVKDRIHSIRVGKGSNVGASLMLNFDDPPVGYFGATFFSVSFRSGGADGKWNVIKTGVTSPGATNKDASEAKDTATLQQLEDDSNSLSSGEIAGIVIGVLLAVALIVGLLYFFYPAIQTKINKMRAGSDTPPDFSNSPSYIDPADIANEVGLNDTDETASRGAIISDPQKEEVHYDNTV